MRAENGRVAACARRQCATGRWHTQSAQHVLDACGGDPANGLANAEAAARLARDGSNEVADAPERGWLQIYLHQFRSPLVAILLIAAVLAAVLGHHPDTWVILAVVLANAVLGATQEGRAERSMAALRRLASIQARVLRDGRERMLPARELVVGDLLLLSGGDAVPADARVIEAARLQAMEAALTGESVPVHKSPDPLPEPTALADRRNMLWSGTFITGGRGRAVVVATGAATEVGRIAEFTQAARSVPTPLEARLQRFGRTLLVASLALFTAVLALGYLRRLPFDEVLMVAISQMVSVVPEGLPVAMTIALAVGMQRMAARGAIIRRLAAVETIGSITVICTDKTGTLTRNEMTVVRLWVLGREIDVEGGHMLAGSLRVAGAAMAGGDGALQELIRAAVLCNDADLLPPDTAPGRSTFVGDPTEAALLVLATRAGADLRRLRADAARCGELPFDPDAKLMATAHATSDGRRVYVKGAPEAVLRLTAALDGDGPTQAARAAAERMAAGALRVLAFAVVDGALDAAAGFDGLPGRARLLGLVGQIDPPRPEAGTAVMQCRAAGIRPIMVTGDHKLTGLAIARALGIARGDDRAVDGLELERMGAVELREAIAHTAVFARVQPAQKLRIVQALQARGEVVAMTGDGVNDAPALARADVGVAMGITGTEVAKSAARVVLTDDNFATLVLAVEQGRVVYANIKKVILYLFATSLDEVLVLLLALLAGFPLPLQAVQILWINIVTEGTVTVNLVMDPPDGDEMRRPPLPRQDRLLDAAMVRRLLLLVPVTVAVVFGWFAWRITQGAPVDLVRTETFTLLAICQWFNVLNCQSATRSALRLGVLRNGWLLAGLGLSMSLQGLVVYWPPLGAMFHTLPLPAGTVLALVLLGSVVLWVEELRKLAARR